MFASESEFGSRLLCRRKKSVYAKSLAAKNRRGECGRGRMAWKPCSYRFASLIAQWNAAGAETERKRAPKSIRERGERWHSLRKAPAAAAVVALGNANYKCPAKRGAAAGCFQPRKFKVHMQRAAVQRMSADAVHRIPGLQPTRTSRRRRKVCLPFHLGVIDVSFFFYWCFDNARWFLARSNYPCANFRWLCPALDWNGLNCAEEMDSILGSNKHNNTYSWTKQNIIINADRGKFVNLRMGSVLCSRQKITLCNCQLVWHFVRGQRIIRYIFWFPTFVTWFISYGAETCDEFKIQKNLFEKHLFIFFYLWQRLFIRARISSRRRNEMISLLQYVVLLALFIL